MSVGRWILAESRDTDRRIVVSERLLYNFTCSRVAVKCKVVYSFQRGGNFSSRCKFTFHRDGNFSPGWKVLSAFSELLCREKFIEKPLSMLTC